MPKLEGDDRTEFVSVLEQGVRFNGYVNYLEQARAGLDEHLGGWTQKGVTSELVVYAKAGGKISRNEELREHWQDFWRYCYHLWPVIGGTKLYFEARFSNDDPDDQEIQIVNVHLP